jgi:glycosyltransferase involved in cell wall biosynthesis
LALLGGVDAGGQNVHVAELARGLADLGAEVVVYTRRDDPSLPRQVQVSTRVVVEHVDAGPAAPVPKDELLRYMDLFAEHLRRSWLAERPDVVHSHFWMSGYAAQQAAMTLGVPVAHTYHALGVVKRRNQGARDTSPMPRLRIESNIARSVELVLATSHDERAELVAMGAPPCRVQVVPCGVDLDLFHPGPEPGARTPPRRLVVVSRLVERKGIGNVIAALAAIPDAELLVAGGAPRVDGIADPEAVRLLELARATGVEERVEFLGAVERQRVPELLRSAAVVVCCPWYEPFGLVAIEAMACGVPVVATATGGLAESIVDGVTGVLVPPRRPAAIAAAINGLLDDDVRRRLMATNAARRAYRYSWRQVAAETYGHLVGLAQTRRLASITDSGEPA